VFSLTRILVLPVALVALAGCTPAASPPRAGIPSDVDSAGTIWGDEYAGLAIDGGETMRALPGGFDAQCAGGETRTVRIDAFAHGAEIHARSYPGGDVGSVVWRGQGWLREVVAGDVTPVIAEGALIGDPRSGADLRAPGGMRLRGLSLRPSASAWSSVTGAGMVVGLGSYRVGFGGWQSRDGPSVRVATTSVEYGAHGGTMGVAISASDDRRRAGSAYGAFTGDAALVSGELARSGNRTRAVVHAVAGERREWRAIAIAGAGAATGEPLVFARKERWGAALERTDEWSRVASRTGVSTLSRRDVVSDTRRRRAFWDGEWRVTGSTRLQIAARLTREETSRAAGAALAETPQHTIADDWRARVTLRAQRIAGNGWITEHSYRVEWVQNRTGHPGIVAAWGWRLRAGPIDTRVSASAHALESGQVSYGTDAAPPGTTVYSPVTGTGATLGASMRWSIQRHAWLGVVWAQTPPRTSRVWITVGVRG